MRHQQAVAGGQPQQSCHLQQVGITHRASAQHASEQGTCAVMLLLRPCWITACDTVPLALRCTSDVLSTLQVQVLHLHGEQREPRLRLRKDVGWPEGWVCAGVPGQQQCAKHGAGPTQLHYVSRAKREKHRVNHFCVSNTIIISVWLCFVQLVDDVTFTSRHVLPLCWPQV